MLTNEILDLLILLFVGVALVVFGNYKRTERKKLIASGIKTDGVIFKMEKIVTGTNNLSNRTSANYPVVRYTTLEKEWVTKQYLVGGILSSYKEGDKVAVVYDKSDIERFIIDDAPTRLLGPITMIFGFLLIAASLLKYFFPLILK